MSLIDSIRTSIRSVVTLMGEAWTYRRMSSTLAAASRTFGSWTAITAIPVPNVSAGDETDAEGRWSRVERRSIRVLDTAVALTTGDQVTAPDGTIWDVDGRDSGGDVGSVRYRLRRDVTGLKADSREGA
jgi:hypothetical protein